MSESQKRHNIKYRELVITVPKPFRNPEAVSILKRNIVGLLKLLAYGVNSDAADGPKKG